MDRGAWHATLHVVSKNWTRLNDFYSFMKAFEITVAMSIPDSSN